MIEHFTCTVCDGEFTSLDIKDRGLILIAEYRDADLYRDPATRLVHCLRSVTHEAPSEAAEGEQCSEQ